MMLTRKHYEESEKKGNSICIKCAVREYGLNPIPTVSDIKALYRKIFANFSSLGGYTVLFNSKGDGSNLCGKCAMKRFILDKEDMYIGTYEEGPMLNCDDCNEEIESSYGDPEERTV